MYLLILLLLILIITTVILFKKHSRLNIYIVATAQLIFGLLFFYYISAIFNFSIYIIASMFIILSLSILVFIVFLIFNSKKLLEKEGSRLSNLLSLGLSLLLLWIIVTSPVAFFINKSLASYIFVVYIFIVSLLIYFLSLFNSCFILSLFYSRRKVNTNIRYILVLGSGLIEDKVPPLLQSRIDIGKNFSDSKKDADIKFLLSGGQGKDERISEAQAMKNYLISQGVNENKIICENKSQSTYENLQFSKKLIKKNTNILICSNNFHILRAVFIAKKLKYQHFYSLGSKTKNYFFTNAFIRELIAILKMDWVFHLCIIISLIFWMVFTLFKL
ncbi:YdcF family protein [Staphylococcus arlettae]|uniref:YdcF family protein n=1 Tax=Staphylococcus arlettae TaxID=29378 RepID=UPI0021CFDBD1|nr:YdcF family protein [Staphylococcus arlettae]UXU51220.1 YdcF family protein [Staphylococcus arlettae]